MEVEIFFFAFRSRQVLAGILSEFFPRTSVFPEATFSFPKLFFCQTIKYLGQEAFPTDGYTIKRVRVSQKNMKIQKVDIHRLFRVCYDPISLFMAKLY